MISGDNIHTASQAAIQAGIINSDDVAGKFVCMNGPEFRSLSGGIREVLDKDGKSKCEIVNKQNFRQIGMKLRVLARSTPEDKFILVTGLKEMDASVAVTADGINDVPAL
jgi:Ca2+ transporting ATPase